MTTAAQIRAEHEAAIASLDPRQAMAVRRLIEASAMASFPEATKGNRLERLFVLEAGARDRIKAEIEALPANI